MPAPKKPAAASQEVAAIEAEKAALQKQEDALKQAAPKFNPASALRVKTPYRHAQTAQTIFYLDQGWCFTATGIPVSAASAAEIAAQAVAVEPAAPPAATPPDPAA